MTRIFNSKVECLNEVERLKLLQKRNPLRPEMIPPELANSSQWIVWSYEVYERKNGKFGPNKTPYKARNPRLQPSRWGISDCSDLVTALQCVKDNSHIDGIGYLFSKDDGLIGVDFDDCRNPQTGKVRKEYQFWIDRLSGYAEVSPSGAGIKIWVKGTVDNRCFKTDESTGFRIQNFADGIIEVYRRGQYFTVTTQCLKGFEHIKPAQEELDVLSEFYLSYTRNALSGSWVSGEHGPNVVDKVIEQNFWGEINSGDIDESDIQFKPTRQTVITGPPTTPKPQLVLQGPHILEERASLCQCTGCINCSLSRYADQCDRSRKVAHFESCSTCLPYPPTELYELCFECYKESTDHEKRVEKTVEEYFATLGVQGFSAKTQHVIQFGSRNGKPDVVLIKDDGKTFAAIAECKGSGYVGHGIEQLKSYLSATDTRFGIFANRIDPGQWKFYENRRGHDIPEIDRDKFENGVVEQIEKHPLLVDEIQSLASRETALKTKVVDLKRNEFELNVSIESRRTRLGELETGIQALIQTRNNRQAACKELEVKIDQLDTQKSELETEIKRLEGEIQSLVSRETEQRKKVKILKGDERELNVSVESRHAQLDGLKIEIETLSQTERNIRASNKKLEAETNEIGNWKSELEIEVGQLENLKSRLHRWQSIIIPLGIVSLVLFFSLGALFLKQRSTTEDAVHEKVVLTNQLTQKESEIRRKDSETQGLTLSVQTLKSENETLSQKISELENRRRNRTLPTDTTSKSIAGLQGQLSEQKDKNQRLQNQLVKKDTEVRQLRNDKAVALSENRRLQSRLAEDRQGTTNQNATVRQLPSENLKLQNRNQDLARQNQELQNKNKVLQNQLDSAKQSNSDQVDKSPSRPDDGQQFTVSPQTENLVAEPPEKIQDFTMVSTRAGSHNNQGCLDFEGNNYDEAVKQFEQAIKADSKFAVAHYNLGCAYFKMEEYSSAVDAFDRAIALDQKFKEAYYNRSFAYFRTSQFQEAKQDAIKALDIDRNYRLAQELLTAVANVQQ